MLGWAIGAGAGLAGYFVARSLRKDAAIKSGEVMDVRDLLTDGEGDCLVRVLGERLYRVELQIEATISVDAPPELPCRLTVYRTGENGDEGVVYDGTRSLSALRSFAAGSQKQPGGTLQFWGSLPLLEFRSPAIVRLRFEAAMPVGEDAGRIDKASLVVKEDVRPMVASSKELDRIELPLPYPS